MDYTALTRLCTAPQECFDVQGRITKWNSVVALLYNICGRAFGSNAGSASSRDFPRQEGGMRMAKNDKGRSFYEWATLIIKLLTALAALVATVTELLRLS